MSRDKQDKAILAIQIAYLHSKANDSSLLCLNDAHTCYDTAQYDAACKRALDSLVHSVGVYHQDYQKVLKLHQLNA